MVEMGNIIAVDIGGTHLRAAVYEPEHLKPAVQRRAETRASESGVFDRLVKLIEEIWPSSAVEAIGLASPGPLNPHSGFIWGTPNIKEWENFPLGPRLSARFGVPVFINNDAKLAGLAEWKFGAGKGHQHVLYLTVSTGVGGGVISHGRLLEGSSGLATEIGHIVLDPDGPICGCGFRGHLEAYSSGTAIVRYVLEKLEAGTRSCLTPHPDLSASEVAAAARAGDALAVAAYRRAGEYLGIGVANLVHVFNPSVVIFGGGVSQAGALLFEPFEASLRQRLFNPHYLDGLTVRQAALGDESGLLGALALAQINLQSLRKE